MLQVLLVRYRCYYRGLTLQMPPCMGQGVVTQGSAHSASMQAAVRLQSASRPHDTRDPWLRDTAGTCG